MARPLPRAFFARDADVVARDLLGRTLVHETPRGGRLSARIVETEAYFGPPTRNAHLAQRDDMRATLRRRLLKEGDPASHSFRGVTHRNRVMYGPPGYWYVYLIYGMHECANVVTGPKGRSGEFTQSDRFEPQAVLLRAAEALDGRDQMPRTDLRGPAKLCHAMGITRAAYGLDATKRPLWFEEGAPVARVDVTARIGVASDLPLRFVEQDSPFASRRTKGSSKLRASAAR